jgi:2-isopropylmalate synthase
LECTGNTSSRGRQKRKRHSHDRIRGTHHGVTVDRRAGTRNAKEAQALKARLEREIFDEDLQALVSDEAVTPEDEHFKLVSLRVASETGEVPHARLVLSVGGSEQASDAQGGGPVDAAFKAVEKVVQSASELLLYSVNSITAGTDAQGEVTVRLSKAGRVVNGQGADTDIVVASVKAYLSALNRLHSGPERAHPQVSP